MDPNNTSKVVATIISRRITWNTDNIQHLRFMSFDLSVAIFYINYFCACIIDRKNIVFVVSELIEPSCRHG